jgi:hypothetical protein
LLVQKPEVVSEVASQLISRLWPDIDIDV